MTSQEIQQLIQDEQVERAIREFDPADCSGTFDGFGVTSDADPGL